MSNTRGYTLIELIIASGVGGALTLAAVGAASHQTRALGLTNADLELAQASRAGLDRMKVDLRLAGAGVGYLSNGEFAGLQLGSFTRGGASFNSRNNLLEGDGTAYTTVTDDIGIVTANGEYATIANWSANGTGQLCRGTEIKGGDIVLVRSEDGLSARTVLITGTQTGLCELGDCKAGCDDFTWQPDDRFTSGDEAANASYSGGEAASGFTQITWFVETSDPNRLGGRLRRVVGNCELRDHNCGEVMLDNVESLQFRVYQRNREGWTDRTGGEARIESRDRIRVDVEMFVRSRAQVADTPQHGKAASLEPQLCFPACGTTDGFLRRVVRTSVEIKNSGRVSYRRPGT